MIYLVGLRQVCCEIKFPNYGVRRAEYFLENSFRFVKFSTGFAGLSWLVFAYFYMPVGQK